MNTLTLTPDTLNFTIFISSSNLSKTHKHNFFEFLIVQSGTIEHQTDRAKTSLSLGDIVFIAPGTSHSYYTDSPATHYDVLIKDTFFKEICNFLFADEYNNMVKKGCAQIRVPPEDITTLENLIYTWQETVDIDTKDAISKIITGMLICHVITSKTDLTKKSSFKEMCLHAMNQYYSLPDALTLIRNDLGYNEIYLCRKFKDCFGCTLVDYVNNLRLNYAAYLLDTISLTISECASRVGLSSLPYFNKLFKKKYGVTPSQYKKKHNTSTSRQS